MACSEGAEEVGGRRNRRRSAVAGARNRRAWRRHEAPGLDSFNGDGEDDEADLLVASVCRGAAGSGGAMVKRMVAVFFVGSHRRRRKSEKRWGRRREGGGRGALGLVR
jgi:hypothetical protein